MQGMSDEVDRVYSTFLTRAVRKPHCPSQKDNRPILIAAPDRSGGKRGSATVAQASINDGVHMHGILIVPRQCRLRRIKRHFNENERLYVKNQLLNLHLRRIKSDVANVVDYAFKSIKYHKFAAEDILVFPKAQAERGARGCRDNVSGV